MEWSATKTSHFGAEIDQGADPEYTVLTLRDIMTSSDMEIFGNINTDTHNRY